MVAKPDAKDWVVKEQIIEDPVSGLTIQFAVDPEGLPRLVIFGDLPDGNRDFIFGTDGIEAGAGTGLSGVCAPSWLQVLR